MSVKKNSTERYFIFANYILENTWNSHTSPDLKDNKRVLTISSISIGHQKGLDWLIDWFLWESCGTTHYRQVAVFQLCRCSTHNPRRRSWTWSWDKKFVHCQFEEGSRAGRAPEPTAVPSAQRWVRLCSWQHDGTSTTPSHTSMHVHVSNQQTTTTHRCGRNNMELNRFQMISNGSEAWQDCTEAA